MKNLGFLIVVLVIFLGSGIFLLAKTMGNRQYRGYVSDTKSAIQTLVDFVSGYLQQLDQPSQTDTQTIINIEDSLPTKGPQTTKTTPTPVVKTNTNSHTTININGQTVYDSQNPKPTTAPTSKPQPKTCYRMKVPHLDGSSSNLCYSQSDYQQLSALITQYSSAKSSYEYQLRVQTMYEDAQKEAFNPDFYQSSIDEAKSKAQEYKDKMGQIALNMYNIEAKGW